MTKPSKVCVEVDCRCPFSSDWRYYPKDIIGIHRIDINNPRAVVGSIWAKENHCCGYYYSQGCNEESCIPSGEVTTVFTDCNICPKKDECLFKEKICDIPAL